MKLHSSLTTVTPVTKALALLLFIALPVVTFIIGMNYGYKFGMTEEQIIDTKADLAEMKNIEQTPEATVSPSATNVPAPTTNFPFINQIENFPYIYHGEFKGEPVLAFVNSEQDGDIQPSTAVYFVYLNKENSDFFTNYQNYKTSFDQIKSARKLHQGVDLAGLKFNTNEYTGWVTNNSKTKKYYTYRLGNNIYLAEFSIANQTSKSIFYKNLNELYPDSGATHYPTEVFDDKYISIEYGTCYQCDGSMASQTIILNLINGKYKAISEVDNKPTLNLTYNKNNKSMTFENVVLSNEKKPDCAVGYEHCDLYVGNGTYTTISLTDLE